MEDGVSNGFKENPEISGLGNEVDCGALDQDRKPWKGSRLECEGDDEFVDF